MLEFLLPSLLKTYYDEALAENNKDDNNLNALFLS